MRSFIYYGENGFGPEVIVQSQLVMGLVLRLLNSISEAKCGRIDIRPAIRPHAHAWEIPRILLNDMKTDLLYQNAP